MRDTPTSMAERITLILDAFSSTNQTLGLDDLVTSTRLPRATTFRILTQLVDLNWLTRERVGFRLGPRWQSLAARTTDYAQLRSIAVPILDVLQRRTGSVVLLVVLEGGRVHYLDKLGGVSSSYPSNVGSRFPADRTMSGRAMLSLLDPDQIDAIAHDLDAGQSGDPKDMERLHRELAAVRQRNGVATHHAIQPRFGITGAGAAIQGPDGPVAGISMTGQPDIDVERIIPLVLGAARRISDKLFPGHRPGEHTRVSRMLRAGNAFADAAQNPAS